MEKYVFIIAVALILQGLFPAVSFAGVPAITDASTAVVGGKTMSIIGNNFGLRSSPTPSYFSNFDADSGVLDGWTLAAGTVSTSTDRAHSDGKSLLFDLNDSFVQMRRDIGVANTVYITTWMYIDDSLNTATQFQYKSWRLTSDPDAYNIKATTSTTAILNDNWWKSGTGWYNNFAHSYYAGGTKLTTTSGASDQFLFNQWQRVEQLWISSSGPDTPDGKMYLTRVGRPGFIAAKTNYVTRTATDKPWHYLMFGQAAINGTGGTPHIKVYYDDLYVDTTQARVEVCDADSWSARTNCEIQPTTTWADGAITAIGNVGSFNPGQTGYLYVVDGSGNVSNPVRVTIGAPAPPRNLRPVAN